MMSSVQEANESVKIPYRIVRMLFNIGDLLSEFTPLVANIVQKSTLIRLGLVHIEVNQYKKNINSLHFALMTGNLTKK